ncbi:L-histidine N(alpha)-methyltransferase [uncultured Pseudokineococcus sp.]|uniref:L-histidine N(alpha)-methyltransferase n=1 Tax=uncultured Pseudokineococcus sp. TaxID=1642928 RepID=UPI00260FF4C2|nr:L-histidine N(alpha)-methyltransferase [uncultured Pseudokineococcus sp.]
MTSSATEDVDERAPRPGEVVLESHLTAEDLAAALRDDARAGLQSTPKRLPSKYLYDERGSRLFDEITRLPEYYPTRRERALLELVADEVAEVTGAHALVELGSGTSEKTLLLLDALARAGTLRSVVPFDVDAVTLAAAGRQLAARYPGVGVHAVVGDFERHVRALPRTGGRRLVVFLGSTIGNLEEGPRARFLADVAANLGPDDAFLLGTDLVKDVGRLVAAYDDEAGVTADFNRNVLRVLRRELGAELDEEDFDHVARWVPAHERVEMHLRARRDLRVAVPALDLVVDFAEGEELWTEVSGKFRRESLTAELEAAGLAVRRWWTDPDGDVALSLSTPVGPARAAG